MKYLTLETVMRAKARLSVLLCGREWWIVMEGGQRFNGVESRWLKDGRVFMDV